MTSEIYTLEQFVADLDRITTRETAPEAITTQIAPLERGEHAVEIGHQLLVERGREGLRGRRGPARLDRPAFLLPLG
ncbi:MAG TPA: hypothetical protein VK547_05710 [Candidatus Udaeobacter sp.]|nr:hypothetical protein [Candidatus Udaeobacter sp.]